MSKIHQLEAQKELFSKAKNRELDNFLSRNGNTRQFVEAAGIVSLLEAKMIESSEDWGGSYREQFSRALSSVLGVDPTKYNVEVLTEDEQAAAETFAQTAYATGGGNTPLTGLIATNITPLMDKYFYDSPIMKEITILQLGIGDVKVTDIINDRLATAGNETQAPAAVDNTESVDTLSPSINIQDQFDFSYLLNEINDPVTMAMKTGKQMRGVRNKADSMIIGDPALATNGANQFWSILNNQPATGSNRGSLAIPVIGVGVANHVDAINYTFGQMPMFDAASVKGLAVIGNWASINRVMRTTDANNQYYYDSATDSVRSLQNGGKLIINPFMPANIIGCWDLRNVQLKMVSLPRFRTFLGKNMITLICEMNCDAGIGMAYKATPTKNGFRHFTLETDNNYAS
ncbi:MAG: hypothetical protein ACRC80_00270 [Waterburya sp.]